MVKVSSNTIARETMRRHLLLTRVNGVKVANVELANRSTWTEVSTTDTGKLIRDMEKVS